MHSTQITLPEAPIIVHHNGGYDGDIWVPCYKDKTHAPRTKYVVLGTASMPDYIAIPFEVMKEIVMAKIRSDIISRVEDMDADELIDAIINGEALA
jgi:hypothetical protein